MKQWKTYQIVLFTVLCIALNDLGQRIASSLALPIWLDSVGTVLCAYINGPVCGAIVGVISIGMKSLSNNYSYVYALTALALGVIVGLAAKKERLSTFFGTMSISAQALTFSAS